MKNCTIKDIESQLEQGISKLKSPEYKSLESLLHALVPAGYQPRVSLFDRDKGRKKRRSASAENWSPESGEIRISFEPELARPRHETTGVVPQRTLPKRLSTERPQLPDPIADLVRSLDRAEAKPGYEFVALKWFRDLVLPAEGYDWAKSESSRQNVLREAIERRLVLTSKVPNPKSPQFPVTAVRLNRLLPETQAILGENAMSDSEFRPAPIRGEGLSATIIRDRR